MSTFMRNYAREDYTDRDTAHRGHFLKQLKHPSHDLLSTIWHHDDQYCVQEGPGRVSK